MIIAELSFTRPLEDTPSVTESPEVIYSYYYRSPSFFPLHRYDRNVKALSGEVGCLVIVGKDAVHPVARVVTSEPWDWRRRRPAL